MKRWLYIFLLVFLAGCQSVDAIPTETGIASTATQVLTFTPTTSPSPTSTLTPPPTLTPTPRPCPTTDANKIYKPPEDQFYKIEIQSIENFLSAGGDSQQLAMYYEVAVEELNADAVPEILVQSGSLFKRLLLFTCINGEYKEQLTREDKVDVGLAEQIKILAIDDLNKNSAPELVYKTLTCLWLRCGGLFVVEWDGEKFSNLIKDESFGETVDYADMSDPQDAYLKDLDNDGIPELVWIGDEIPEWHSDHWFFYPQRLATHIYKWDGKNYSALPVTYGPPEFRFQAVQDGDRFALAGDYQKALEFYELTITSNNLDWWTEDRWNYIMEQQGVGSCADGTPCPFPVPDPRERPILGAYATYRIMLVNILMNNLDNAEESYQTLLTDFPVDNPGYPIVEMATLFWNEFQASHNIAKACDQSVAYITKHPDVLEILTGGNGLQEILYENNSNEVCPFK